MSLSEKGENNASGKMLQREGLDQLERTEVKLVMD